MAFFCEKTGVRIAAPGVSKSVDPINGHAEVIESASGEVVATPGDAPVMPKPKVGKGEAKTSEAAEGSAKPADKPGKV